MTFEAFLELYERDMLPRLKENTWLSKEHMIRTKLLPYCGKRMISKINIKDIITEGLKATDQLEWVQRMNSIRSRAEEIVREEVIGLRQNMSRRGNCWDKAPQESFYGHMKDEL